MKTTLLKLMSVLAFCCATPTSTVYAQEAERCLAQVGAEGSLAAVALPPGYSVLNPQLPLTMPQVDGELRAIMCTRASISIAPLDHHVVIDLRVPLFLSDGARVMVLEIVEGQLRTRFLQGEASEAESIVLRGALERAQLDIQRVAPPPAG